MPLTRADKIQIDQYIQAGEIHKARRMLEDDGSPQAQKALEKLNLKYPPTVNRPKFVPVSPPRTAPVLPSPTLTDLAPDIARDEMADVRLAIREKRYEDAEALLILSDHPDAEKLRERLGQVRGGGKPLPSSRKPLSSISTGSAIRRGILAILVLVVVGVGGTLFALQQKELAERPDNIYLQLFGVCLYLASRQDGYEAVPDDVMTTACRYTAQDFIEDYPKDAEYCYLESKGDTLAWFACDSPAVSEISVDYIVAALNMYR